MCGRIQNAVGIMVLNHWEVMWTVGRNDLFHYAVPNIWNTSARGLLLPKPCPILTFFPSCWRIGLQFCKMTIICLSQGINNLKVQCNELLGFCSCIHLHCVFFFSSAAAHRVSSRKLLFIFFGIWAAKSLHKWKALTILPNVFVYSRILMLPFFIKPLGHWRQHF